MMPRARALITPTMSADGSAQERSVVAGVVVAEFLFRQINLIRRDDLDHAQDHQTVSYDGASVTIEVNGNAISMTPAKVVQPLSIASESLIP